LALVPGHALRHQLGQGQGLLRVHIRLGQGRLQFAQHRGVGGEQQRHQGRVLRGLGVGRQARQGGPLVRLAQGDEQRVQRVLVLGQAARQGGPLVRLAQGDEQRVQRVLVLGQAARQGGGNLLCQRSQRRLPVVALGHAASCRVRWSTVPRVRFGPHCTKISRDC